MPLFHVHGLLAGFLAPLHSGGSVIAPPRFSASEFWTDFTTYKANWYTAVPTIHQILLRSPLPSKVPDIRFIRSCSSPLSPQTFYELEKTFHAPVVEAYAMTEGAHQMTSNPLPPLDRYPGSVGFGWGVEVKILDQGSNEVIQGSEGEICIRGDNVTKGYLNNPDANRSSFTSGGFFRTGDQGLQDKNGYVMITGRIKELINKGGEKISPVAIDNLMTQHPAVADAVTFAIADDMYGQDVGAAVVLHEGAQVSKDELRKWMATKMAKFKVAKKVCAAYSDTSMQSLKSIDLLYQGHAEDCYWKGAKKKGSRCYARGRTMQGQTVTDAELRSNEHWIGLTRYLLPVQIQSLKLSRLVIAF